MTDPRSGVHHFAFDSLVRLKSDQDPATGTKTLTRNETANQDHNVELGSGADVSYVVSLLTELRSRC